MARRNEEIVDELQGFELTEGEKAHPLWARLKSHLEEQLRVCRARNDGLLSEMETAMLRGQIKAIKAIIRLGEARPPTGD